MTAGLRKRIEKIDEREREVAKLLQALELSLDPRQPRLIFTGDLFNLLFEFPLQAVEAADPSIASADHSRVDEQSLPMLRCPQLFFRFWRDLGLFYRTDVRKQLALHRHPRGIALRWCAFLVGLRNLAERQVFAEARGCQSFRCACEQGKERSSRGIGPAAALGEERRYAGAPQRVLDQGLIAFGISKENGHPVECDAGLSSGQYRAGHLDALAGFVGGGSKFECRVGLRAGSKSRRCARGGGSARWGLRCGCLEVLCSTPAPRVNRSRRGQM